MEEFDGEDEFVEEEGLGFILANSASYCKLGE